ncbi:MAG TPA: class I SAM-dependent methyltransferase, partial [Anaerolineae bacterium]|nr:class I SAM-dependent methyltransferase [Anaerolineae bacterium]
MGLLTKLFKQKNQPIVVDVLTGYAQWAKNYPAQAHNPLMEIEERAMLSLLPDDLSSRVCLDLACGSGRYMRLMRSRRAQQVFGVDYSADMLVQAINSQLAIGHSQLARSAFL